MDDYHKLKITFFFGAGAEGRDNFGIATGYEYLKSSLYSKEYMAGFTDALSKYFSHMYFNEKYKYSAHTLDAKNFLLKSFIKHKILISVEFLKSYKAKIRSLLSSDDIQELNEELDEGVELNWEGPKDAECPSIKTEFNDILTGATTHYSDIKSKFLKDLFTEKLGEIDFDINIGTAGYLDSYFHTIINPPKYGNGKFSKIFNYYWANYFTILKGVLLYLSKSSDQFNIYFCGDRLNYLEVLKNINNLTDTIYKTDIELGESYYALIKEAINKNKEKIECRAVITTNYFKFCEGIGKETVYLNGQLNQFEYPETLDVMPMEKMQTDGTMLFFPFIFGQSQVKPIVHRFQTQAFSRFEEILKETNLLVILGFNLNEDDNHINAFIHDYINNGGRVIIVTDDESPKVHLKLKCREDQIDYCQVKYGDNSKVVKELFEYIKKYEVQ